MSVRGDSQLQEYLQNTFRFMIFSYFEPNSDLSIQTALTNNLVSFGVDKSRK